MLDELDQDPARGGGMEERDPVAARADSRDMVDERDSGGSEPLQVAFDVHGAVGDVMQGRAATSQEPADRGVGPEGLEKLDVAGEGDLHALGVEGLGSGTGLSRKEFVEGAALFDGMDGDRDVVDRAGSLRDRGHRRMLHSAHTGDKEKWNADE